MMSEPLFISSLGAIVAIVIARSIGGAIRGRDGTQSEMTQLKEQLDEQATVLENVEANVDRQLSQITELQERLDFAERLLMQHRDRTALEPGSVRES